MSVNKSNINTAIAMYLLFPSILFGVLNGFNEEFIVAFAFVVFIFGTYEMISEVIASTLNENNFKTYQTFKNLQINLLNINFVLKNQLKNNQLLLAKNNVLFFYLTKNIQNKYNIILISLIKNYVRNINVKFDNLKIFINKLTKKLFLFLNKNLINISLVKDQNSLSKLATLNDNKLDRSLLVQFYLKK